MWILYKLELYLLIYIYRFTLFIQPYLLHTYNHRKLCMCAGFGSAIICLWMPSIYWFTFSNNDILTDKWFLLIMVFLVEGIFTGTFSIAFVVSGCYVNNSVPNSVVGKANGVGQSIGALVRGILLIMIFIRWIVFTYEYNIKTKGVGPIITGFIWSESITSMEDGNHVFVYFAYLPAAFLYMTMFFHLWIKIPSDLQLTWEQRKIRNKQSKWLYNL